MKKKIVYCLLLMAMVMLAQTSSNLAGVVTAGQENFNMPPITLLHAPKLSATWGSGCNPTTPMNTGDTTTCVITLNKPATKGGTFTPTVADPTQFEVPASVPISVNGTTVTFVITAL